MFATWCHGRRSDASIKCPCPGMIRPFHGMSEALIHHLYRDEARSLTPPEGPPCAPVGTGSIHRKLEKVKFPEFFGAPDGATSKAWLENMAM
jgi:hypothetical protein